MTLVLGMINDVTLNWMKGKNDRKSLEFKSDDSCVRFYFAGG